MGDTKRPRALGCLGRPAGRLIESCLAGFAVLGEPGRHSHGLARRSKLKAHRAAAGYDGTRGHTDSDFESCRPVSFGKTALNLVCCSDRAASVVLVDVGKTEHGGDRVPRRRLDRAFVSLHRLRHCAECAREHMSKNLGVDLRTVLGCESNVNVHGCHGLPLRTHFWRRFGRYWGSSRRIRLGFRRSLSGNLGVQRGVLLKDRLLQLTE